MERFFSTLKTERCARIVYQIRGQTRANVFDYIEWLYNPFRKHSELDYLSPVHFEERQSLKGQANCPGNREVSIAPD